MSLILEHFSRCTDYSDRKVCPSVSLSLFSEILQNKVSEALGGLTECQPIFYGIIDGIGEAVGHGTHSHYADLLELFEGMVLSPPKFYLCVPIKFRVCWEASNLGLGHCCAVNSVCAVAMTSRCTRNLLKDYPSVTLLYNLSM